MIAERARGKGPPFNLVQRYRDQLIYFRRICFQENIYYAITSFSVQRILFGFELRRVERRSIYCNWLWRQKGYSVWSALTRPPYINLIWGNTNEQVTENSTEIWWIEDASVDWTRRRLGRLRLMNDIVMPQCHFLWSSIELFVAQVNSSWIVFSLWWLNIMFSFARLLYGRYKG